MRRTAPLDAVAEKRGQPQIRRFWGFGKPLATSVLITVFSVPMVLFVIIV
jgi:hypothetical protein